MKKNSIITLALFSIIAIQCQQKQVNENSIEEKSLEKGITFPHKIHLPKKESGILKTSMIASEVQFIPLETNNNSLLRGVSKMKSNDSLFILSDNRRLILFDKNGLFIRQIGTSGKGPGEYNLIFDFALYKDTIYLTSTGKSSVIKYTLDGEFQDEIDIEQQLTHFTVSPKGEIVAYDYGQGELKFFSPSLQLLNKYSPENLEKLPGIYTIWDGFNTYFQTAKNKLLFSSYFNDTVWDISNGQKNATYIFDLQDKLLPRELEVNFKGNSEKFNNLFADYYKINFLETQDKLFIFQKSWVERDVNSIFVHDMELAETIKYEAPSIKDDMVSGMDLKISPYMFTEDALVAAINPTTILEFLEESGSNEKPEPFEAWKSKMQKLKFDDNPVLVIIKTK